MTTASMVASLARLRLAGGQRAMARVRLVFEGRQHGTDALARLLREPPARRLELDLVALAVPRVPGGVRLRLGDARATEWVMAAANGALDEMGAVLAGASIPYRAHVEVGTHRRALQAALREGEADFYVVATGWPRWYVAWLAGNRGNARPDRMFVA